ncbi:hypothetical protein O181_032023 [Austropuccinia psidii MF-1]|uniref:Uncharacterized protein n=1 Tax=Austropuccinia psidii MF-1 TaxID=1389203 RepID=A0A9Q3H555_9BASI|nr:hypothetical protein [Austropuccinia psidii MF-1]
MVACHRKYVLVCYSCPGSPCFTGKSLRLCTFPIIQTIAYTRAGFQRFTCKLLCLYKLPTIQTTPYASEGSLHLQRKSLHCAASRQFKIFLTPVLAYDNSHADPDACAGSQQSKQFLTPEQASEQFTCTSLLFCRF